MIKKTTYSCLNKNLLYDYDDSTLMDIAPISVTH